MAMEVDLALNARRFQAGTKDAERALEGLSDVIDDFTRDASDAGEEGASSFDDMGDAAKDAEREFDDAARSIDDVRDELGRAEDAARDLGRKGKDAGDDMHDGMRRASDGVNEFRDEANSTARESAASFDGSAESIGDAFQEIAANAFGGFGPAGAVAGIAAAAGIGLVTAGFDAANEAAELSKERAAEWAAAFIEAGATVLDASTQAAMAQDIITDPERWQEAQDNAREWGVSTAVSVAAMTGETWALDAAQASLNERQEEAVGTSGAYTDAYGNVSLVQQGANQELVNGQEALNAINQEIENGTIGAATYSDTLILMAQNTDGATQSTNEFGDSVYALPDGTVVTVDADTGQAVLDVSNVAEDINNLPDGNSTINVTTGPVNSSSVAAYIRSRPSVELQIRARTQGGIAIPV
ncbi:hypothetical protein GCM10009846_10250 [Agrococcus versicolor]|uniref:Phage tail tape measure protein n=1 Tax=Agrococcus versicolor TaxID=501482 RepID=A0ABN3AMI4_9MICO